MNKELKSALKTAFEAPEPKKKREFLQAVPQPSVSYPAFLCTQFKYIRKRVWVCSVLVFTGALMGALYMKQDMLWQVSALMPLLALAFITESGRSEMYRMAELELSARFSLKSVILARLGILGLADFLLMCLLIPLVFLNGGLAFFQTAVYLACPYLLTAFLGLWVVRKVRGKEGFILCTGTAVGISMGNIVICRGYPSVYQQQNYGWWIGALLVLCGCVVRECIKMIKQTEELSWSL